MARDLDTGDRVTVLACDSTCRTMPGELRRPGAEAAREVRRFLEHETPQGASDVALAVERGFAALADSGRQLEVVYLGDGTATAGPTRASTLELAVRASLPRDGRVTSIGIGPESDAESLLALARGGAGSALPYVPGQPLSDAALAALSALYGQALSNPRLELPPGVTQVSPSRLDPIVAGSEIVIAGRLESQRLEGTAVLRGTLNGKPFEQRYPLDVAVSESTGNAFVPRLFAAARIADLERDGSDGARREAVALSIEQRVASRFTSLLVLESEAMYKAFGLEHSRQAPEYTADFEAEGGSADGELALGDDAADKTASKLGSGGGGFEQPLAELEKSGRSAEAMPASPRPAALGAPRRAAGLADVERGSGPSAAPAPQFAPPPPATAAAPTSRSERPRDEPKKKAAIDLDQNRVLTTEPLPSQPSPRRWVPMRRVWERRGEVFRDRFVPKAASADALAHAERELMRDGSRRQSLKQLFALSSAAGDLTAAARLAERWLDKEPLDPEAITALADVEARRGHRDVAIRMLGSVLDVRPGDTAAHKRLARLERWAGRPELACRHAIAIAEGKSRDLALVADAVRCARATGMAALAEALLAAAPVGDRANIEQRAEQRPADDATLLGDLRVEASWSGGPDLDLSLLDTEGHRISWLGAGTRSVISARDALSSSREGLALRGAAPGEYVIELTRGAGAGSAQGELVVSLPNGTQRIPFSFEGDRKAVALVRLSMHAKLVPL
jgi:hypothetical protein